jgi:FtsP/CotA-like multicopper oxidase with cupredoxin domain
MKPIDRREFVRVAGAATLLGNLPGLATALASDALRAAPNPTTKADYTVRIGSARIELGPGHVVSTTAYNGQFPGPLLRFTEGRRVTVDIYNDTDTPEQFHWHGQTVPVDVDGAAEEGTPFVPAHGLRRVSFVPGPPGLRFYHSHLLAGKDLNKGLYSAQAGPVYIEPRREPGRFDREVFLVLKEFEPELSRGGDMAMDFLLPATIDRRLKESGEAAMAASLKRGMPHGYEVGYKTFSINGHMLGAGEPIRVKSGERVLFHVLNASATEIRSLALPGHTFTVVALDGNPVPTPAPVQTLWIGTAERVSAIVEMKHPGVWILGDLADDDRQRGMGVVLEYAGAKGEPRWAKPTHGKWDYTRFGQGTAPAPDEVIEMIFAKRNAAREGFNEWTINGIAFSMTPMEPLFHVRPGRRYRLRMRNESDDIHPIHLHRHSFELARIAGKPTGGILKDVVMLGGYQEIAVDFVADNPGRTLFHCHQQLHMDFGFMALFDYVAS